jgi:metal-responsive CopG/Arc/MetJ family transcriptional regulator
MPDTSPTEARVIVTLPFSLLAEVEDYRHRHRIPSRSETIRRMLLTAAILGQCQDATVSTAA